MRSSGELLDRLRQAAGSRRERVDRRWTPVSARVRPRRSASHPNSAPPTADEANGSAISRPLVRSLEREFAPDVVQHERVEQDVHGVEHPPERGRHERSRARTPAPSATSVECSGDSPRFSVLTLSVLDFGSWVWVGFGAARHRAPPLAPRLSSRAAAHDAGELRGPWRVAVDAERVGMHRDIAHPSRGCAHGHPGRCRSPAADESRIVNDGARQVPWRQRSVGEVGAVGERLSGTGAIPRRRRPGATARSPRGPRARGSGRRTRRPGRLHDASAGSPAAWLYSAPCGLTCARRTPSPGAIPSERRHLIEHELRPSDGRLSAIARRPNAWRSGYPGCAPMRTAARGQRGPCGE